MANTLLTNLVAPAASGLVTVSGTQTLTNKTLSSVVLIGTVTADGDAGTSGQVLSSTGTGVEWVNQTGGGGGGVAGYTNSSLTAFPSGDLQGDEAYVGHSGSNTDAFGVSILAIFTCMDPVGSTQTTDLGVLT
jgi:hypothetical protein